MYFYYQVIFFDFSGNVSKIISLTIYKNEVTGTKVSRHKGATYFAAVFCRCCSFKLF